MSFLISNAMAAATTVSASPQARQAEGVLQLVMIAGIFVLLYFMLIRPQTKRAREHRDLINQLKKGDEVATSGGLIGKIVNLNDQYIRINLSDGVEVMLQRQAISAVLPKGTLKAL